LFSFCFNFFIIFGSLPSGWKPTIEPSDPELIIAVKQQSIDDVRFFLEHKENVDSRDKFGFSVLHWSVLVENIEITKLLIKCGADVNAKSGGWKVTPLMNAVSRGNISLVKLLLEFGADPDYKDLKGRYAVTLTTNREIICLLRAHMKKKENAPIWKLILGYFLDK